MASQVQQAKTLSKSQQSKSMKGVQKSKKLTIKNTLDSPFSLDWPVIDAKNEEEIKLLLQKSCSGLKDVACKPPWKQVQKLKGAERREYLSDFKRKFLESLDPDAVKRKKEREDALSNLIFGYNAVMRALENDLVSGILVKKNVQPTFVVKTFLPGCANKCIPLIPVHDLDAVLKHEDTLALPHACMVLGLKPSATEDANRFFPLYSKMCEAINMEEDLADEEWEEQLEPSTQDPCNEDNKENNGGQFKRQTDEQASSYDLKHTHQFKALTDEQVASYHLKRTHKNKRAFTPGERKAQKVDPMGVGSDFIGFGAAPTDDPPELNVGRLFGRRPGTKLTKKMHSKNKGEIENTQSDMETQDFDSMFLIDETGDQDVLQEEVTGVKEDSKVAGVTTVKPGKGERKRKLKAKKSGDHASYIPAKTKRVKSNPNRKEKVKKRKGK